MSEEQRSAFDKIAKDAFTIEWLPYDWSVNGKE
jgi:hypothetical protein